MAEQMGYFFKILSRRKNVYTNFLDLYMDLAKGNAKVLCTGTYFGDSSQFDGDCMINTTCVNTLWLNNFNTIQVRAIVINTNPLALGYISNDITMTSSNFSNFLKAVDMFE